MNPHTSTRTAIALILSFAVTGCGDDRPPPAPLAEHCGAHAPVRLLELQPDQAIFWTYSIGDRLYFPLARTDASGNFMYPYVDQQLWSTGLCGESPRHIADDTRLIHTAGDPNDPNPWPDLLLGCQAGTGVVILDPEGVTPPQALFPGEECYGEWTEHGFLRITTGDAPDFAFLLYPYPDDPRAGPVEPTVVIDGLPTGQPIEVTDNILHVIASDASLLRIDLSDLGTTRVQTDVRDYAFSPDGRYLLWQDATITGGTPDQPTGDLLLRDTVSNLGIGLGSFAGSLTLYADWLPDDRLLLLQDGQARLYQLPGLTFSDLPPGARLQQILDDGRVLITKPEPGDWLGIFDPADRGFKPLFSRQAQFFGVEDGAAIVLDVREEPFDLERAEGKVWSVPLDGSAAHLLAERATRHIIRLDDTRLLTPVDVADGRHESTFLLVDTTTRDEYSVADHVTGWFFPDYDDRHLLIYSAFDGERTSLWQARLASTP